MYGITELYTITVSWQKVMRKEKKPSRYFCIKQQVSNEQELRKSEL